MSNSAWSQSQRLSELENRIRLASETPQDADLSGVHGLLVEQHGRRLAEWYFAGRDETIGERGVIDLGELRFSPDRLHDVRSVTKTIVALSFGIALRDGKIESLDASVPSFFPEHADLQQADRRAIRLRDLLSMTSGLRWDEFTYPYSDPRNSEIAMEMADDPFHYALSRPIDAPPGSRWAYSGGDVALIGSIISRATGQPLEEYARERLFAPLGIAFEWSRNRGGARAASGLRLKPDDMIKLGNLLLDQGVHEGQELVPRSWVAAMAQRHASVEAEVDCGTGYGYFLWLNPVCQLDPELPVLAAVGNGGQRIWVIPSMELVIAMTAGRYNSPTQGKMADAVLVEVLKAVQWGT